MHAIISAGGKQYQVSPGETIQINRLEANHGDPFETNQVLLFKQDDQLRIGHPLVEGVTVKGTVVDHLKDKKVIIFKRKRRKGYRRKAGHRQEYTVVKIDAITA